MTNKETKALLLSLHKKWLKRGKLPYGGLCPSLNKLTFSYPVFKEYFKPSDKDLITLNREDEVSGYWGSGLTLFNKIDDIVCKYTPRRQSLMLLFIESYDWLVKKEKKEKKEKYKKKTFPLQEI
jgi:hypothetical protein